MLRKLRELPNVKKVFIRSGIRFDYLMADKDDMFFRELCEHHVSGQLKVAPEHISDAVLQKMGKPENRVYEAFTEKYKKINQKLGKNSVFSSVSDVFSSGINDERGGRACRVFERSWLYAGAGTGFLPDTFDDFNLHVLYGGGSENNGKVYVPVNPHEKAMQRALIQYRNPKNYDLVMEAAEKGGTYGSGRI